MRPELRRAIQAEYDEVARHPHKGFHFHTGRPLCEIVGYDDAWLAGVPEASIESFAGTGCPFRMGVLEEGERVVDIGCGAGIDTFVAANMVTASGAAIGVDMTEAMLAKARAGVRATGHRHVEIREALAEQLPVEAGWADVIISNGVFNLLVDKPSALAEMRRVLKPGRAPADR